MEGASQRLASQRTQPVRTSEATARWMDKPPSHKPMRGLFMKYRETADCFSTDGAQESSSAAHDTLCLTSHPLRSRLHKKQRR